MPRRRQPTHDPLEQASKRVLHLAARSKGEFSPIAQDFLELLYEQFNHRRMRGTIDEGTYRQKGNIWGELIRELLRRRCGVVFRKGRLHGLTDIHAVDFYYGRAENPEIVGEAKMLGSPATKDKPVRRGATDIDKRLKEVKYTPLDLKLRYTGPAIRDWHRWLRSSGPQFFTFWAFRVEPGESIPRIVKKCSDLAAYYNNGVGIFLFTPSPRGPGYVPLSFESETELRIDDCLAAVQSSLRAPEP